jgi:molybdopterin/thiamine biosynthesis adenylyltransferase
VEPDLKEILQPFLLAQAPPGQEPFESITWAGIQKLASLKNLGHSQSMAACLRQGIWPERLRPNKGTLSAGDQVRLLESRVAVLGAGGLGGTAILLLARLGLGGLNICDSDSFDESNLNRQFLSSRASLGQNKADRAAQEVAGINPALEAKVFAEPAGPGNLPQILAGADVALDCLDNMPTRYDLEQAAGQMGIPYVHGAVAGLEGFVMTVRPGDPGLAGLYGPEPAPKEEAAETVLGVPTMIPAAIATLQVNEVVKLLLGQPGLGPGQVLHLDLSGPSLTIMSLA